MAGRSVAAAEVDAGSVSSMLVPALPVRVPVKVSREPSIARAPGARASKARVLPLGAWM